VLCSAPGGGEPALTDTRGKARGRPRPCAAHNTVGAVHTATAAITHTPTHKSSALSPAPPSHRTTGPPSHRTTEPPSHRTTGPPSYRTTEPLHHRTTELHVPDHRTTGPPDHRATAELPSHRITGSPSHRATEAEPPERVTAQAHVWRNWLTLLDRALGTVQLTARAEPHTPTHPVRLPCAPPKKKACGSRQ
jgi:hypothetical protein